MRFHSMLLTMTLQICSYNSDLSQRPASFLQINLVVGKYSCLGWRRVRKLSCFLCLIKQREEQDSDQWRRKGSVIHFWWTKAWLKEEAEVCCCNNELKSVPQKWIYVHIREGMGQLGTGFELSWWQAREVGRSLRQGDVVMPAPRHLLAFPTSPTRSVRLEKNLNTEG